MLIDAFYTQSRSHPTRFVSQRVFNCPKQKKKGRESNQKLMQTIFIYAFKKNKKYLTSIILRSIDKKYNAIHRGITNTNQNATQT